MLEDGSRKVHLPLAVPLDKEVLDEFIVVRPLALVHIILIVEHILDVFRHLVFVLGPELADMLLLTPARLAKPLDFNRSFCFFWVGHFQSAQ